MTLSYEPRNGERLNGMPTLAQALEQRVQQKEAQIEAILTHEIAPLQEKVRRLRDELQRLQQELKVAKSEPRVSDHALIRYLERKLGLDFEAYRRELLTPERAEAIRRGARHIRYDNTTFRVAGNTIVTVLHD